MKLILVSLFCVFTLLLLTLEVKSHVIKRDVSRVTRADKPTKTDTTDKKNSSKEKKKTENTEAVQESFGKQSVKPGKERKKENRDESLSPSFLGVTQNEDQINKNDSSKEKNKSSKEKTKKENAQAVRDSLGKNSVKPAKETAKKGAAKKENKGDSLSPSVLSVAQKGEQINKKNSSKEKTKNTQAAQESFRKDPVKAVKENTIPLKGADKKENKDDSRSPPILGVAQKDNQINKKNSSKEKNKNPQAAQQSIGKDSIKPVKEKAIQLKSAEQQGGNDDSDEVNISPSVSCVKQKDGKINSPESNKKVQVAQEPLGNDSAKPTKVKALKVKSAETFSKSGVAEEENNLKRNLLPEPPGTILTPEGKDDAARASCNSEAQCRVQVTDGKSDSSLMVINIHRVDIKADHINWET